MEDNLTNQPLPDEAQNVPSAGGEVAESNVASLKDILGAELGKDFPTDEAALKAVKDTFNFVGKKQEPQVVEKEVVPADFAQKLEQQQKELNELKFYKEHPELEAHKALLDRFGNVEEALQDPSVQKALEALKAQDETEKSKSVLNSNARLGVPSSDYETDFEKAKASGNWAEFLSKHKGVALPE